MSTVVYTLPNGWAIHKIESKDDLLKEDRELHERKSCLGRDGSLWENRMNDGYFLFSLRDPDDNPKATFLAGDAERVINNRAGSGYCAYFNNKIFNQSPREIPGIGNVISLECCPAGLFGPGDPEYTREETLMIKDWYESFPIPNEYETLRVDDPMQRIAYSDFVRERLQNPNTTLTRGTIAR